MRLCVCGGVCDAAGVWSCVWLHASLAVSMLSGSFWSHDHQPEPLQNDSLLYWSTTGENRKRGGETERGQWQRKKMRKDGGANKEGMRRGKSCRKGKHQQYIRLIGMHRWVCSKNCFGYFGHHSIVICNDFSHKKRKNN